MWLSQIPVIQWKKIVETGEKKRERKNVKIGGESDELGATFLFIF